MSAGVGVSRLGHHVSLSSLARSSCTLSQRQRSTLLLSTNQPSLHGGGGRFKSTAAAATAIHRLTPNNNSNESSSSKSLSASSLSSLATSFWDAAASTIQSGLSTSVQQSSVYFQALRWKAANSLMTSLSDSERQKLVQRLGLLPTVNNNSDNNDSHVNRGIGESVEMMENKTATTSTTTPVVLSVAEAVAAARVQEAMRSKNIGSTETAAAAQRREELWRQAQQAAHARVVTEIAALQQHVEKEEAAAAANSNDTTTKECSILGPVVYDLGYKRCHVVSASQLTSIPVWEKQRIYRHDRAKTMAKDKLKTLHLGMPGVISLHEDLQCKLSILDGQHRVGMMAILVEEMQQQKQGNNSTLDLTKILVEVYPENKNSDTTTSRSGDSSSSHAADLFVEINKAEPVKLVDLPGMGAKKSEANVINHGAHLVQERFPEMFSASQRCRPPHLNLDNLRDALFQAQVVTRAKLKSPKALEMWLLEQNDVLKQKYTTTQSDSGGDDESTAAWSVSKAALEKARKYDFYLGLETSWLSK